MLDVKIVASYIFQRYFKEFKEKIDEMKLHKLLYLVQRESIIQTGEPMFDAEFQAWVYGPVIVRVRDLYRNDSLNDVINEEKLSQFHNIFDVVFANYAHKDSWSLSVLTHGESSWQNARKGYADNDTNCSKELDINDINNDAERIKLRRFYFENILPQMQ